MTKVTSNLPATVTTSPLFNQWAQGIGAALKALGWVKASDTNGYQISNSSGTWNSLTSVPGQYSGYPNLITARGAWSSANNYSGGNGTGVNCDVATSGGVTYLCVENTAMAATQVIQNTTQALTLSAVATSSNGTAVYTGTITGGGTNAFVGFVFVITGFTNGQNNGTFICTASSATTLTLANGNAISETHAGTAASSTANMGIVGTFYTTATNAGANYYVGHTIKTTGFLNSANNVASATVIASGGASTSYIGIVNAGTNETHSGTVTDMTSPSGDLYLDTSGSWAGGHWVIYPFEVWTTNDGLTPIYLKLTYRQALSGGTARPTIGIAIGVGYDGNANITTSYINLTGSNGPDAAFNSNINAPDGGSTLYECDFAGDTGSFRMIMWRTGTSTANVLNIERGRDANGNAVGTFFTVNWIPSNVSGAQQSLFASGSGPSAGGGYVSTGWATPPVTGSAQVSGTTLVNNIVAALPVFPIVGYVGNPLLNLVTFLASDINEGGNINVVVYGNSHTYLTTKKFTQALGIRWE